MKVMYATSHTKIQFTSKAVFIPWGQDFYLITHNASMDVF